MADALLTLKYCFCALPPPGRIFGAHDPEEMFSVCPAGDVTSRKTLSSEEDGPRDPRLGICGTRVGEGVGVISMSTNGLVSIAGV